LLEIPPASALAVFVTITILVQFGKRLLKLAGWGASGVGLGFVAGLGVLTFGGQFLLVLGVNPNVAHWTVLLVMLGVATIAKRYTAGTKPTRGDPNEHELLLVLSIAFLAFAVRHPWLIPYAVSLVLVERMPSDRFGVRTQFALIAMLITAGALFSRMMTPTDWWNFYLNGDANHMESLSWSASHWSVLEQPGNLGQSTAAYHWLGHNFYGVLSHVAGLGPWKAMMNIGLPIINLILVSLVLEPAEREHGKVNSAQWMLALLLTIGSGFFRVDSFSFGILVGLAVLNLFLKDLELRSRPQFRFILWCLLFATLTFSKTTTSLTITLVLLAFGMYQLARKRRFPWVPVTACVTTNIVIYLLIFRQSIYTDNVGSRLPLTDGTVLEVLENTLLFAVTPVLLPIIAMAVLVGRSTTRNLAALDNLLVIIAVLFAGSVGLGLFGFAYHQRVGTPLLVLAAAGCTWKLLVNLSGCSLSATFQRIQRIQRAIWTLGVMLSFISALTFSIAVNRLVLRFEIDTTDPKIEIMIRGIRVLGPYLILALAIVALLLRAPKAVRKRVALLLTAATLAVTAGTRLDSSRRVLAWGTSVYYNWPANDSPFPNDDLSNVGEYIRSNTSADAILASNNFCCFGNRWWSDIITQIEVSGEESLPFYALSDTWLNQLPVEQQPQVASIIWGGDNYQTVAVTRRRFLMQGLSFQQGFLDRPTPDQLRRMSLSLDFANAPSAKGAAALKSYGVSGYIVNLSLTNIRDWTPYAREMFRDGQFVYLEFR